MTRTATLLFFLFFAFSSCFAQVDGLVEARDRAVHFLLSQQREDGSFADSSNALFNVWETILVADALQTVNQPEAQDALSRARAFLRASENPQGLICHNSKCQAATCVETSAYYIWLLADDSLSDVKQKLALLANLQNPNGSWFVLNPDVHERTDYVSVTAFVVNLFARFNFSDFNKKGALDYIAGQQLPEGSWGQSWEYYNVPGYAFWQCMEALKNEADYAENYALGLDHILRTQHKDGSWYYRDPAIPNCTSPELQTALMLQTLEASASPTAIEARNKGLLFLLDGQLPHGGFQGGNFPIQNPRYKKAEYLFATALALKAIQLALNNSEP
jgi:squalene cyclase